MEGYICLSRRLQEHWLWKDEPYDKARAWIDLLFLANYEDRKTSYKGEIIVCKRGDVNLSISYLSKRWKWSRKKTTAFLNLLEKDNMVTTKATKHRTTITIEKYDDYQFQGATKGTTKGATRVSTKEQPRNITNKVKEIKKNNIPSQNSFMRFEKADYDFDEIERKINEG